MQNLLQSPQNHISQSSSFVSRCLQEYEQKLNQENQFSDYDSDQENISPQQIMADQESLKYYGYQDKKSITIKPIKMHKDLISLRKQNNQKKKIIRQLQQSNYELKHKYQSSMKQNQKVEKFLKDIQFTFKNDKKAQKANQIMLKAKKMLYRQALQCQNNAKKITKGSQANTVQQIKMYIQFLQAQKQRLKATIDKKRKQNQQMKQEEDFNMQNQQKFEQTLQRVEKMLNIEMQRTKRHSEIYKIQKGMVSTGLKQKEIMLKKKSIQKYYQKLKDLMLKKEGQQYEIVVLEKKRKDKIKLIQEMKQFKNDIHFKKTSIQQLQKQLKQKMKTYDYMSKWTKQLKGKLQQKKQHHISNKISFQKKINALSRQFQDWNKKYKLQLVEQQLGTINANGNGGNNRKKGNTAKQIFFGNTKDYVGQSQSSGSNSTISKKAKLIKIQEIRKLVKKVKIWILENQIYLQEFLKYKILNWKDNNQEQNPKNGKNVLFINKNLSLGNNMKLLQQRDRNIVSNVFSNNGKKNQNDGTKIDGQNTNNINSQENQPTISLKQLFDNFKNQFSILKNQPQAQIMKLARYVVEDNQNTSTAISVTFNNIKTSDGFVANLSIGKRLALTILKNMFQNQLKSGEQIQQTKHKLKQFLIRFYDPFRYDILKMLLSMGGLKGIQRQQIQDQKQSLSCTPVLDNSQPSNGSQNMSNMKRNQQLHLQLQLDETIFMKKLEKHVVEEYYVVRFKQLFDLIIYQQFGQTQKPRLGMFDRVCQIVTQKKLIKQNVSRDYNFESIKSLDGQPDQRRQRDQNLYKQMPKAEKTGQIVIKSQTSTDGYWIVKPEKRVSGVSGVNIKIDEQNESQQQNENKQLKSDKLKQKNWLDDLMQDEDDGHEQQQQIKSYYSIEYD